ncbi:hypothetical protein Y032_0247g64 [Ancylostoma ceylanicum]|uniref:Uncharacterized protein n=1 Tax=Ancylostoma ceylanicum TaxID=53326 RepID=A0A016SDJ0_9BILA|nr:hypothetical protein Y032_0247g64 [Ancylostoma ceylanicum]
MPLFGHPSSTGVRVHVAKMYCASRFSKLKADWAGRSDEGGEACPSATKIQVMSIRIGGDKSRLTGLRSRHTYSPPQLPMLAQLQLVSSCVGSTDAVTFYSIFSMLQILLFICLFLLSLPSEACLGGLGGGGACCGQPACPTPCGK